MGLYGALGVNRERPVNPQEPQQPSHVEWTPSQCLMGCGNTLLRKQCSMCLDFSHFITEI